MFLLYRCKSFQTAKRSEICRIPGSSVSPAASGAPTPIRLPQFQGDTFRQFIVYVYTGKILLQDSGVFEMLCLAQELGVDELRTSCEEYVTSTLSVLNACTFLAAAMDIQDRCAGLCCDCVILDRFKSDFPRSQSSTVRTQFQHSPISVNGSDTTRHSPISVNGSGMTRHSPISRHDTTQSQHSPITVNGSNTTQHSPISVNGSDTTRHSPISVNGSGMTRHSPISVNGSDTTQHSPTSVNASDTTQSQHSPINVNQTLSCCGTQKVQKVMVQPINLIFRFLQTRSKVQVWLYENVNLRIEGHIVGFDEYMNLVLDEAEEFYVKTNTRKPLGRLMLKGDNITLIQNVSPGVATAIVPGSGKGAKSFVERCISYVGENALECVKTNSFLNLSKDALIKLISSDYLSMEEEDVWRAVLNWAKYQAGVTQPTAHWAEEERARVCQHLSGVINHVRLLLIDSQVFAEEVEPTGAVPMELSLERYRYAALPNKFRENSEDKRLQPRVSLKLFPGSQILVQDKMSYQRVLNTWYGSSKQVWRLVYRASSHGYSAEAFHRHCDGVAPTYVIVMVSY
uniref:Probable small nuclear ribonucleoprotein E n=1 Tax=Timema californicum TaxID=61474 RepID=A0A7R9JEX1_TIMCA|nr:unnamed protein product [Timema californicum]